MPSVAGVVLAAGAGTRLGAPKALVRLGGELLVDRAVGVVRGAGCAPIVVVLGAEAARVERESERLHECAVVRNEAWATGMGSSLRAALAALADTRGTGRDAVAEAAVILLVDQPGVTVAAVQRLVAAWHDGAQAAVATYRAAPRNPVLLARATWAEAAAAAEGDAGGRAFLRAAPERWVGVPCDDVADPYDVDTPADAARTGAVLPSVAAGGPPAATH